MKIRSAAGWLAARCGSSVGAGLGSIWRGLTRYGLVWQFAAIFAFLSLVLVVGTGFGLSRYLAHAIKEGEISDAAQDVRERVSGQILTRLSAGHDLMPLTTEEYGEFDSFVREDIIAGGALEVKIWGADGTVIYSSASPSEVGQTFPVSSELAAALNSDTATRVVSPDEGESLAGSGSQRFLAVYAPLIFEDAAGAAAVLEIHQPYEPIAERIQRSQTSIYLGVAGAMGFLYAALLLIVTRAFGMFGRHRGQLVRRSQELKRNYDSLLRMLYTALDLRDRATKGQSLRVARLAVAIGWQLGLSPQELTHLEQAAMLHDVGKVALPDAILQKAGPLSQDEWDKVQRHPEVGYQIVKDVPFLREAGEIILCHHERYDGGGYPRGLKGERIPLAARIFAVAEAYNAITSDRPYRQGASHAAATREIKRNAGTQFDPKVVEGFLDADRKGAIQHNALPGKEAEEAEDVQLVAPAVQGEESHG